MNAAVKETNRIGKAIRRLCPLRHGLLAAGGLLALLYHAHKGDKTLMQRISEGFTQPFHRLMARLTGAVPFSVAELLYALLILFLLIYLPVQIAGIIRKPQKRKRTYRLLLTVLSVAASLYGGYCLLWGVFYAGVDFQSDIGVQGEPVAAEELYAAGVYFADLANSCASETERDADGCFTADIDELFEASESLYDGVSALYPALSGESVRAKPMLFSRMMSHINFTGFFFPFTGEANLNVDAPLCLLPSTIAHEQAHQRGVAPEDEANFAAVLACWYSGEPEYRYSGALLALIHLSNALYEADHELFLELRARYSDEIMADLQQINAYWQQYETKAAELSETVYEGILATYGEERGMQSYGACVDLLVAWYRQQIAS